MTVYLVGAGPGDPGLLTRRGAQLLRRADVVLHDRLISSALLDLVPPSAELINVGKVPEAGGGLQEDIGRLLVEHGRRAGTVVRLKGGDPFLFGRGGEETEVLSEAGIAWEVVPGVTSAFGVPAAVGIPVTQRGLASSVTVVTGRVGDEAGAQGGPDWAALARTGGTLVVLMGMTTRAAVADALVRAGKAPETPVAVIAEGTLAGQRMARTTLAGLAEVDLHAPAVIVIGAVAALGSDERPAAAGPLSGWTVVATRAGAQAKGLVDALEQAGARVVQLPLTRTVEPADGGAALRAATDVVASFDWVVFTSQNAVDRFMGSVRDARALSGVGVAAVGPATADALRLAGVEPDLVPAEHSARGLVDDFAEGSGRVLFPSADLAPDTLVEGLAAKGWRVERVEAYRTVPVTDPDPTVLARVGTADAIVFAATSSVRAFASLRQPDGAPVRVPGHVVCIGPTTAAAARDAGMANVVEGWGATAEGMVAELVEHFGHHHGDAS